MTTKSAHDGSGAAPRSRAAVLLGAALHAVRSVAGYMNAVLGGQDYARYVAHLRHRHPDRPIPTESEYWRDRHAAAERNPGTRCC
ncbi:YbdD/YjiX family protein [Nocardia nova]|uniref:YbdD/YjiX family protein n=1 Tax=Nocardia nova TaxID=37330 RepID=UPI0033F0348B